MCASILPPLIKDKALLIVNIIAVIPARYQSSRFPGKPLAMIAGKSLLQRTFENTSLSEHFKKIVIATDDHRILEHALGFCDDVYMTSPHCANGTERIIDVLEKIENKIEADFVINVQGDEPCVPKENIAACIGALEAGASMASLVQEVSLQDAKDPSLVKCVMDHKKQALYFSRSLIPYPQKNKDKCIYYRHIGLYAYSRDFLVKYGKLNNSPLQMSEDLEQLKVLEQGYNIQMAIVKGTGPGVDQIEDIKKVEDYLCSQNTSL